MFQKNLEVLNNDALKKRLEKISLTESKVDISYCVTPSKDYVMLKNELPTDDLNNPREAVKKMLAQNITTEMKTNDIIINFGLGLGYLLDETFNTYKSRILVYEPDLKFLHFVLNNVDISEMLASGRVYITNDLNELINKLNSMYLTKDKVEITYIPTYAIIYNKELMILTQKVYEACKTKIVDINTITKFSQRWMENTIKNISYVNNSDAYLLSDLESKFLGQTAIVAGAGPSLNDNIEYIKNNRSKYVIFAVNKVVGYLLENKIVPDFVVCLDAGNMYTTLGSYSEQLSEVNCIADIRTDSYINDIHFKKIFYNFSNTDFVIKNLAKYNENIRSIETGGSASTLALSAASLMGFSNIILAGVDLALKENVLYANGDLANKISPDVILADNIKKNIVSVKSVTGKQVNTREDYEVFIRHFEMIIKDYVKANVYNISSFGANIEGAVNCALDDIEGVLNANTKPLQYVTPFKINLEVFLKEEFNHINDIISILSNNTFSPALASAIIKSSLIYQFMQADILTALQMEFKPELAEDFINNTKNSIKFVVDLLKKYKFM